MAQSYLNPGGSGERRFRAIGLTKPSDLVLTIGTMYFLIDGNDTTTTADDLYWANQTAAGKYLDFDFGEGRVIDEAEWVQDIASSQGVWRWQGSNDGASFVNIGGTFTLGTSPTQVHTTLNGNTTRYRIYRMLGVSGDLTNGPYLRGIRFRIDEGGAGATTYQNAVSVGDRTALITVTLAPDTSFTNTANTQKCVEGVRQVPLVSFPYFNTLAAAPEATVKFDFVTPKVINGGRYWTDAILPAATVKWQGSNNDTTWTDITGYFPLQGVERGEVTGLSGNTVDVWLDLAEQLSGNTGSYRYYRLYKADGTDQSNLPYLAQFTFKASDGTAPVDANATGAVGTLTVTPPQGVVEVEVSANAEGAIGTLTIAPPQGTPATPAFAEGAIGTLTLSAPQVTILYNTQIGAAIAATPRGDLLDNQTGLVVTARIRANERVTQMGLLVIAKGGETPLVPDPLKLQDGGRQQLLTQRLVNMYVESTPEGPTASARFQRPGLYNVATLGGGPIRATFLHQGFRYTVSGDLVWRDSVNIGTVPAEGQLRWAISDEEVVVVAGNRAYYVTTLGVSRINDPDLPFVRDVKFLAGRFVYFAADTSGQYFYSAVNDAKTIDGLAFASAEANPDRIIGAEVTGEGMAIFGTNTTEFHYPTLDPDNPFQRSQGRTYDKGCLAIQTVQRADNDLHFVGNDRMVYRAAQVPAKVSTYSVDDRMRRQTQEEFENNSAFTITFGGHVFYVLNIVGQGTWALNVGLKLWAEWRSWGKDRFRVSVADADGFMGDALSGQILGFDGKKMVDLDGDPIERIVSTWLPLKSGTMRNFNLALHTQQGVGLLGVDAAKGGDPKVEMRFSDHLGQNWTNWMEGNLGKHGVRGKEALAQWTSLGTFPSPGRAFEFRCTDPVEFTPFQVSFNEWMP